MATLLKRESGRWQARVRKKGGKSISKTFRTKTDAEAWARQQEAEIERGSWRDTSSAHRTSFKELLDEYEREIASKGRSWPVARYHLQRFGEDLGHYRLADLTPRVLIQWRDNRLRAVKPSTVARELATLGGAFTWAKKDKMIALPENPVSAIRRPEPGRARERRLYPGEEEVLLDALGSRPALSGGTQRTGRYRVGPRNPWVKTAVLLALETAMRQGELVSLTWGNVDLEGQTAALERTKNGDSRVVPLSTTAIKILRDIQPPDPLPGVQVLPVSQEALKQAWGRAIQQGREQYVRGAESAGVKTPMPYLEDLTFHDLRHEATSRLAERLPNVIELAAVTGHRDLRMLKRYYHPRASDLAKKLG